MRSMRRKASQISDSETWDILENGVWGTLATVDAYNRIGKPGNDTDASLLMDAYESNLTSGREYMHRQWKMLGYASPKFAYLTDL